MVVVAAHGVGKQLEMDAAALLILFELTGASAAHSLGSAHSNLTATSVFFYLILVLQPRSNNSDWASASYIGLDLD